MMKKRLLGLEKNEVTKMGVLEIPVVALQIYSNYLKPVVGENEYLR